MMTSPDSCLQASLLSQYTTDVFMSSDDNSCQAAVHAPTAETTTKHIYLKLIFSCKCFLHKLPDQWYLLNTRLSSVGARWVAELVRA